jgi:hypothetical protein
MSEDILVEYIKNKIDQISETINNQFDPSVLFGYLFPQSLDENRRQVNMEILPNNNIRTAEMNYIPLMNVDTNQIENVINYEDIKKDLNNEGFTNINDIIPKDVASQMYFASLGILGLYILYGLMKRAKMVPV